MPFTQHKFLCLHTYQQHKQCARALRQSICNTKYIQEYEQFCTWMRLEHIANWSFEQIEQRFHWHIRQTGKGIQEHDFLSHLTTQDNKDKARPWLNIHTYLNGLRSCHNVGSIIRTTEAFRLGPIIFSEDMMPITHPQIKKTSMGSFEHVSITQKNINTLPRPWIGIETIDCAHIYNEWLYPKHCTIIIGNEERGIHTHLLEQCDTIIQIPLVGIKNSINVANAFAIIAAHISYQHMYGQK